MTTVSIVHHSGSGHTAKMAQSVATGVSSVAGVKVNTIALSGKDISSRLPCNTAWRGWARPKRR
jgi:multimeric flavodoxin WrbA